MDQSPKPRRIVLFQLYQTPDSLRCRNESVQVANSKKEEINNQLQSEGGEVVVSKWRLSCVILQGKHEDIVCWWVAKA